MLAVSRGIPRPSLDVLMAASDDCIGGCAALPLEVRYRAAAYVVYRATLRRSLYSQNSDDDGDDDNDDDDDIP